MIDGAPVRAAGTLNGVFGAQEHEPAADWFAILGPRAVRRLRETALLVFTPDAIVSQQVGAGAGLLADAGFRAVSAAPVRITPAVCRRLWRTEQCELPADRLAVCELLLSYTDSIAVLLLDEVVAPASADARHVTAANRLSAVKGPGELSRRLPGTLRAELYSPNSMFRLVHTSDTPLDVVRELGVLFGSGSRRSLLQGLRRCQPLAPAALETMAAVAFDDSRPGGRRRLDASDALRRTIEFARSALREAPDNEELHEVVRLLSELRRGAEVSWRVLSTALQASSVPFDPWDVVVIGALIVCGAADQAMRRTWDG